ncbi:MAG: methyltransferase domain-containing protein [Planctomycetota bacterium]
MKGKIIAVLPEWLKEWLKKLLLCLRKTKWMLLYQGDKKFCPVCGKSSRQFVRFKNSEGARCLYCSALERHRFAWLYLLQKTNLFDGIPKKMLHVAPEHCFEIKLKELLGDCYLTADLSGSRAMVKMDITNIEYPDQSFDVVYCSHVLEHVQNDKKALKEFFRVLKNNGWAILLVPITAEKTFEDDSIITPLERLAAFGQEDHVRMYGKDYIDRLREAGFHVKVTKVGDLAQNEEAEKMGIATSAMREIYFCTKS